MAKRVIESSGSTPSRVFTHPLNDDVLREIYKWIPYYDIPMLCVIMRVSKAQFGLIRDRCRELFTVLLDRLNNTRKRTVRFFWSLKRILTDFDLDDNKSRRCAFNCENTLFLLRIIKLISIRLEPGVAWVGVDRVELSDNVNNVFYMNDVDFSIRRLTELPGISFYDHPKNSEEEEECLSEFEQCLLTGLSQNMVNRALLVYLFIKDRTIRRETHKKDTDILSNVIMNDRHLFSVESVSNTHIRECLFIHFCEDMSYYTLRKRIIYHIVNSNAIYSSLCATILYPQLQIKEVNDHKRNESNGDNEEYDEISYYSPGGTTLYE